MKIICVGRNYAEHAKELGNQVPEDPVIFMKPDTSLLRNNDDFYFPEYSKDIHYECEIVYRVGKEGKYVNKKFAWQHLDGVGLGIDFTARDLQKVAKEKGLPWTLAKGFNNAAPVSEMLPMNRFADHGNLHFEMMLNGETKQKGDSAQMIFPIPVLIEFITRFITIKAGDLIFTGTPAGVGPVKPGDRIQGNLENESLLDFRIR